MAPVVYRCSSGHVFTVGWSPSDHAPVINLGLLSRFQRCPVGSHWTVVKRVNWADLTEEERRAIERRDA
jgi:hypothetical protein